jgi:hypothetical protein
MRQIQALGRIDMRYRAMFHSELNVEKTCEWFRNEILEKGFQSDSELKKNKYDYEFSVLRDDKVHTFSVFSNPNDQASIWLYVKPKLKFFDALFRKNDHQRELATKYSHDILSTSNFITNLGWYTENNVHLNKPTKNP